MNVCYLKAVLPIISLLLICSLTCKGQTKFPTITLQELEKVSSYNFLQFKQFALKKGFQPYDTGTGNQNIETYIFPQKSDYLYILLNKQDTQSIFLTESRSRYMTIKNSLPANGYKYALSKNGYEIYYKNKFVVSLKKNNKPQYEILVRYVPGIISK